MADQDKCRQSIFSLILMLEISILGASILDWTKITYFIQTSGSGEINKGNSSIIGEKEIEIERQSSIISSTTEVEGG